MIAPGIEIVAAILEYQNHLLFHHLNLTIPAMHWTCLLGPSGVGKSSLLRLIAGLTSCAKTLEPITTTDGLPLKDRIAYLPQNETLLPWLSVFDNVLIGAKLRHSKYTAEEREHAERLLNRVDLYACRHLKPEQLSGGMKQRVLLARTLFENRPVILMDEPFASLDVITRTAIQELAAELLKDRTVLLVTHDPLEALRLGHHVYIMSGRPASISAHIELPGIPPRELTDPILLQTQAKILEQLTHAKETLQCQL